MERSVYEYYDDSQDIAPSLLVQPGPILPIAENQPLPIMSPKEMALWRWANVENLDTFLEDVYLYFLEKGFWCIILRRALNMATVLFVVIFTTYLTSCIDYSAIRGAKSLEDIRVTHCLSKTHFVHKLGLWIFGVLWLYKVFQYVGDASRLLELKSFFLHLLHVDENEIQTISWQQVVSRIVQLSNQNMPAGRNVKGTQKKMDAHNIANRIMRKENYLIAIFTKDVLDLNMSLPFLGDYEFLTKTLEWSINLCVVDFAFTQSGKLRPVFLNEGKRELLAEGLRRRFQFAALMNIVCAPFALLYMSVYYIFRYFNEYHRDPGAMGSRQYTPQAEWKLREFNELYHLFTRRLGMSALPAGRYISQFPRVKTDLTLRFVTFVCSAFAAVLGIASIYDPELLSLELSGQNSVLFYIGVFGTVIAVSRGMTATDAAIFEPEAAMRQIVEFTHYLPEAWEANLHSEWVKNEFCKLYDLKVKILLRELLSIFINPIVLWYNLSASSERIVDFFRDSSVHVDDLGYVTSFAVFNFDKANKVKARADDLDKYYSTSDGKMLKSYLNFMDVYGPPSARGLSRRGARDMHFERGSRQLDHSTSDLESPSMSESVMDRFDKLRRLPTVTEDPDDEEAQQNPNNTVRSTEELNLLPDESSDDDAHMPQETGGVFGILNRISQVEGRRR